MMSCVLPQIGICEIIIEEEANKGHKVMMHVWEESSEEKQISSQQPRALTTCTSTAWKITLAYNEKSLLNLLYLKVYISSCIAVE